MSIKHRIDDALALYRAGRFEGALLNVLVAAAATSANEAPKKLTGDRARFETFLKKGAFTRIAKVEFREEMHSLPHIFYKWLRCELVHEAGVPFDIEFIGNPEDPMLSVRAGGAPNYVLQLGYGWFFEILELVQSAPTNSKQFSKEGAEPAGAPDAHSSRR